MRLSARVGAGLAVLLVLTLVPALVSSPERVKASDGTVTTVLQPSWNLAGWTEAEAGIDAIFDDIPQLEVAYAWDAENQRFRVAARSGSETLGDLQRLRPGMGLWLLVTGEDPVTWVRSIVAESADAPLREGWNLIVWGGEDGIASQDALQDIDDILTTALDVNGRSPLELRKGEPYWLDVSGSREWNQAYEPPKVEFVAAFSQEKQDEVRARVDDVVAYFFERLGLRVSGLTVRFGDPETLHCGGYYHKSVITMGICVDYVFAHEYVHAIQDYLTGGGESPPTWFREGHADFWAYIYADARGEGDYVRYLHQRALPLAYAEGFVPSAYAYYSDHARIQTLVKREGPDALNEVFRRGPELGGWQAAFEDVYEMTPAEFNVAFAREMLLIPIGPSLACPLDWYEPEKSHSQASEQACGIVRGALTDLAGNPRSGALVALVRGDYPYTDGLHDAQQRTESDGEFSLTVPEGSYTVIFLPERLGPDFPYPGAHYYDGEGGLRRNLLAANRVPALPESERLVIAYGAIAGSIVTEDGEPASGILARLIDSKDRRHVNFARGAWQFFVGSETYVLEVNCSGRSERRLGWYGGEEGLVRLRSQATPIVLQDADITDLSITLPAGVRCR